MKRLSEPPLPAELIAAVVELMSAPEPLGAPTVVPPTVPPALIPFLVYAAPNAFPRALSKLDAVSYTHLTLPTNREV